MVFFTCFVQGSTIKFFVRGKCPRYFPWPTFKLLCGKSKMSIILLNILTICSVMNITLKGEDEEGRLFKDIQVRTSVTFVSLWTASLYGIVSNNWRIFLLCPKLFFQDDDQWQHHDCYGAHHWTCGLQHCCDKCGGVWQKICQVSNINNCLQYIWHFYCFVVKFWGRIRKSTVLRKG